MKSIPETIIHYEQLKSFYITVHDLYVTPEVVSIDYSSKLDVSYCIWCSCDTNGYFKNVLNGNFQLIVERRADFVWDDCAIVKGIKIYSF